MGSEPQTIRPETGLIRVPLDYPRIPTPGKLELLLQTNEQLIYRRYSPYADYDNGIADIIPSFGVREPIIYDYIDKANKGLSGLRKYETLLPIGSAPRDVIRVSKFLGTGRGSIFLAKQFLLQTTNKFNETRIYNPTSPIIAAGSSLTFGLVRPKRSLDIGGGLLGLARSLIGDSLPDLFGKPVVSPPSGTVAGALPSNNLSGGKGLLRAGTAKKALSKLEASWPSSGNGSAGTSIGSFFSNIARSIFGDFIPQNQSGIKARADEGTYGLMVGGSKGDRFSYVGHSGREFGFGQLWIAGGNIMRKTGQYTALPYKLLATPDGIVEVRNVLGNLSSNIPTVGLVGYDIQLSRNTLKPGFRYGDSVGVNHSDDYEASDIMVQYEPYTQIGNKYPSKKSDKKSIDATNDSLASVLRKIQSPGIYQLTPKNDNIVIPVPNPTYSGYDRIFKTKDKNQSPINYPIGTLAAYRASTVNMIDNSVSTDRINKSKKMPGAGNFDAINTLRILTGDKSDNPRQIKNSPLDNWRTWEPYFDDQIAFFFYDAVNDKYIPFRATVDGIQENNTAQWEEVSFIGRADALYSYGGFRRALSFSFDVLIGSIVELAPTWKRINYLISLTKPASYTTSEFAGQFNRFMVPPMVLLTIGDMYKSQPIVLESVNINVPKEAAWETLNKDNSDGEWSYLVDYMKSNKIGSGGKEFGQFPRMAKISITCNLLEKERAIAGAAVYGHAPHTENYEENDINSYNEMDQALVEYQRAMGSTNTSFQYETGVEQTSTPTPTPTAYPLLSSPSRKEINIRQPETDINSRTNRVDIATGG